MNDFIDINEKIGELKILFAQEAARGEERHKSLGEKIDRALSHSHEAKVVSAANTSAIVILESKVDLLRKDIDEIQKEAVDSIKFKDTSTKKILWSIYNTFITAAVLGIAALIWEHIYNK